MHRLDWKWILPICLAFFAIVRVLMAVWPPVNVPDDTSAMTTLNVAQAEELAKRNGAVILSGLAEVSPEVAEALAKHEGDLLLGITTLSDRVAEALAKHKGWLLMDRLPTLSDTAAASLAKHEGTLNLNGVAELSDKAAQALAKHRRVIWLKGVSTLSDEAAVALAKTEGVLNLDGLTTLSERAAKALLANPKIHPRKNLQQPTPGPLSKSNAASLNLAELTELSDSQAEELLNRPGYLRFAKLESLSVNVAKVLSTYKGGLYFPSLKSLTPAAAASLAKHHGVLALDGLVAIEPEVAAALSRRNSPENRLYLNGLTELSDEEAEALSKQIGGTISLDGLVTLSDKAVESVVKRKGGLSLMGLRAISDKAAATLLGNPDMWLHAEFKRQLAGGHGAGNPPPGARPAISDAKAKVIHQLAEESAPKMAQAVLEEWERNAIRAKARGKIGPVTPLSLAVQTRAYALMTQELQAAFAPYQDDSQIIPQGELELAVRRASTVASQKLFFEFSYPSVP